jgi:hypothetical protein
MLSSLLRRLRKPSHDPLAWKHGAPRLDANCHYEHEDFYLPNLAGAMTFADRATSASTVKQVLNFVKGLSPDAHTAFLVGFYTRGLELFGDDWRFADINTVLHALASMMDIRAYMEVGVRRGKSASLVASLRPDVTIAAFDMWVENYAGMQNPGKDFVRQQLTDIGFRGSVEFIDGDSATTIPKYFAAHPDAFFDVITIDGDHTYEGARRDIQNVLPRLKTGGVLVFDDISSHYHPELNGLWREITADELKFSTFSFVDSGFGIGFAVKKQ